jgi:hypothetical protein
MTEDSRQELITAWRVDAGNGDRLSADLVRATMIALLESAPSTPDDGAVAGMVDAKYLPDVVRALDTYDRLHPDADVNPAADYLARAVRAYLRRR